MAVFIDLWPCLFTTKLSYTPLFKWGRSLSIEHARKLDRESDMKKDNNNSQAFDYSIAYECLLWQKIIGFIFPFPLSIWPDIRYVKVFIFSFSRQIGDCVWAAPKLWFNHFPETLKWKPASPACLFLNGRLNGCSYSGMAGCSGQ